MRGGRFGPHNQHQPQGQACLESRDDIVYLTYFNAGLQVYDISDERDLSQVEITSERGEKETVGLEETLAHSGVFTGSFLLKAVH